MAKRTKKLEEIINEPAKVKLVSFTMSATIRTGDYSNIAPTITVEAETIEQALAYVMPHVDKLFFDYLGKSERRTPVKMTESPALAPNTRPMPPVPAYEKALQAVNSALSVEALDLITKQIGASVKLTPAEKEALAKPVAEKFMQLNGKATPA